MNKSLLVIAFACLGLLFSGCTQENGPEPSPAAGNIPEQVLGEYGIPGNGKVELHWNAVEGAQGYKIYRALSTGGVKTDFIALNSEPVTGTNYSDAGLANGTAYFYAVSAVNSAGEGPKSGEIIAVPFKTGGEREPNATGTVCDQEKNELKVDLCLKNLAVATEDPLMCKKITTLSIDDCLYDLALNANKADYCADIMDSVKKNNCQKETVLNREKITECMDIEAGSTERNDCLKELAVLQSNTAACELIEDQLTRDECFKEIAVKLESYFLCGSVSKTLVAGNYLRDLCYSEILEKKKDLEICGRFLEQEKEMKCLHEMAEELKDFGVCGGIEADENRFECISNVAAVTADPDACMEIPGKALQQKCLILVAESSATSIETCLQIFSHIERNNCLYDIGTSQMDVNACMEITDRDLQTGCLWMIATATNDTEVCEKIRFDMKMKQNECFKEVAVSSYEMEGCDKIGSRDLYIECYSDIARELQDTGICENVTKKFFQEKNIARDDCYYYYALGTADTEICELILSQSLKDKCYYDYFVETDDDSVCDEIVDANLNLVCRGWNEA